jgi:hypothetical protein
MALLQNIMDGSAEVKKLFKILRSTAGKEHGRAGMGHRAVRRPYPMWFLDRLNRKDNGSDVLSISQKVLHGAKDKSVLIVG